MSTATGGASTGAVLGGSAGGSKEVLESVKEYYGQVGARLPRMWLH